ncbi:EEF1A lysine methyltransferase 1 [Venturia canescens]|uniref:EEF1A lysine methyltransferase 1 n=1 Tax=Venturia canescens TaxID=32260 RepID=UPI001C9D5A08|nr:EEF1A lysine methyltransferase 1 [Venturia canescens]
MTESDDDEPQLSQTTLAALHEFYKEREESENQLNKTLIEPGKSTDVTFEENWQLSQFWYDEQTVEAFTKGAIKSTPPDGKIALISCPTLYKSLRKEAGDRTVTLFEYDQRFSAFGKDYVFYDYKSPLLVPRNMSGDFDLVIADPPFLSEECLTKTSVTIKFLAKNKYVVATGAVMADLVERLLGAKKCTFVPHHRNNLANEFWCYANFEFDDALK